MLNAVPGTQLLFFKFLFIVAVGYFESEKGVRKIK